VRPIVGWVVDAFGPRRALGIGAAASFAAAMVALTCLVKHRHLHLRFDGWRPRFTK
jgi:MFS family permease